MNEAESCSWKCENESSSDVCCRLSCAFVCGCYADISWEVFRFCTQCCIVVLGIAPLLLMRRGEVWQVVDPLCLLALNAGPSCKLVLGSPEPHSTEEVL